MNAPAHYRIPFSVPRQVYAALVALATFPLCGCQPALKNPPLPTGCVGKTSVEQAASVLNSRADTLAAFQAVAHCVLAWDLLTDAPRKEWLDAQVRFLPPDHLFLRGDKFGEVRLGTNDQEFWLRIKQVDTYWYGSRQQAMACQADLPIHPSLLAEALGAVRVDGRWELAYRDGWDILTLRDGLQPTKKVYVNACTDLPARIEYFNRDGQLTAAVELADYQPLASAMLLPTTLRIVRVCAGLETSSATIQLRHIQPFAPTDAQRQKLFVRPPRDGYTTVLRLGNNCQFTPE